MINITMILFTLSLSPYDFAFGHFPEKASYQLNVINSYIFISLFIPDRCGILWDWAHTQQFSIRTKFY